MDAEMTLNTVKRVISERRKHYGAAASHWARTVAMINTLYGTDFTARDWGVFMICDKLSRSRGPEDCEDNQVDIVGYGALMGEAAGERTADETEELTRLAELTGISVDELREAGGERNTIRSW